MKSEKRREGLGSSKRFGARYGRKTKLKFSKVETEHRKLHRCPYCSKVAVKRVDLGIWQSVMLAEFDGPRNRNIIITIIKQ